LKRHEYVRDQLYHHVRERLEGKKIRSLVIRPGSISFCYSKQIKPLPAMTVYEVDRNEKNLTFGNKEGVVQIDMSKAVGIG